MQAVQVCYIALLNGRQLVLLRNIAFLQAAAMH